MKVSDFSENEAEIAHHAKVHSVALDDEPAYAAMVGSIISMFALIEDYAPQLLSRLTGLSDQDAHSVMAVFRAFSNRIDLIKAIYKPRGENSVDGVVGSHYVGLLNVANKIRNKYAHATYSATRRSIVIKPFSSDYARSIEPIEQTLFDFEKDRATLRRITAEFHGFIHRNEIPKSLQKQLQRLT